MKFLQKNMAEIILFAENPFDSMFDSITLKFHNEPKTESESVRQRKERIHNMASMIYGWILRQDQPWYKHARWHVHHWKIQVHPWEQFKKMFSKCERDGTAKPKYEHPEA